MAFLFILTTGLQIFYSLFILSIARFTRAFQQ
jgi:hypothetical protein